MKSAGYFAIGAAALILLREPTRRRLGLTVVAATGALYAVYGLVVWSTGDCCVAWQKKVAYLGVVTGPCCCARVPIFAASRHRALPGVWARGSGFCSGAKG